MYLINYLQIDGILHLIQLSVTLLAVNFLDIYILLWSEVFFLLQVILDVVYNHTNEANDVNPYTTSFRGIDNKVLYSSL